MMKELQLALFSKMMETTLFAQASEDTKIGILPVFFLSSTGK